MSSFYYSINNKSHYSCLLEKNKEFMSKLFEYIKNIFFVLLILQFAPPLFENLKKQYGRFFESHTKVGYLSIKGVILNSSYYNQYLKKYFEDKDIKAILLFIESPGGAAGSAEAIAREIELLKKEYPKPIITLSENVLASGGYYVASATDAIIVLPSTLVGSIGTAIPGLFKLEDFIEQYKIHYNVIKAGEYKAVTDPFVNSTPEQNELLQGVVNSSYENFIEHVAKHRPKLLTSSADTWANGKIFTGNQAVALGLVDAIGSRSETIKKIKDMAIIEGKIEWVKPEKQSGFWNLFSTPDFAEDAESFTAKMANTVCTVLEKRYGIMQGLKN
jgi:protease IV